MKKLVALAVVLLIFQKWDDISFFLNPPPDYGADVDDQVILYATSWCGYCAKARKLLKDNRITYIEYDIEKSQEAHDQYRSLGGRGVPVLLINGEVVKGYRPEKILELAKK